VTSSRDCIKAERNKWQFSLRSLLFVVVIIVVLFMPLVIRLSKYDELTRLSAAIQKFGGSESWLEQENLWEREYYGIPEYNTIESIGARDLIQNMFGERKYLHVELQQRSIGREFSDLLSSNNIISVDMYCCQFEEPNSAVFKTARFARTESHTDNEMIAMLTTLTASKLEWLSVMVTNLSETAIQLIASQQDLEILSILALGQIDNVSYLQLNRLSKLREIHLFGLSDLEMLDITALISTDCRIKKFHVSDCSLTKYEKAVLETRFPKIEWIFE